MLASDPTLATATPVASVASANSAVDPAIDMSQFVDPIMGSDSKSPFTSSSMSSSQSSCPPSPATTESNAQTLTETTTPERTIQHEAKSGEKRMRRRKIVRGKWFDRIIIIVLENTDFADALRDPNLSRLHLRDDMKPDALKSHALKSPNTPCHDANAKQRTKDNPSILLYDHRALMHPSQGNYMALVLGDTVVRDDGLHDITTSLRGNLVELLEAKGVSWAVYAEGYPVRRRTDGTVPSGVFLGEVRIGRDRPDDERGDPKPDDAKDDTIYYYCRRHNPFVSLTAVQSSPSRARRVRPAPSRFIRDIEAESHIIDTYDGNDDGKGRQEKKPDDPMNQGDKIAEDDDEGLPQYIFYVPDNRNNGHDTTTRFIGEYISDRWMNLLLRDERLMRGRTLAILTFDETAWLVGSNRVATWLIGSGGVLDLQSRYLKRRPVPLPHDGSAPPGPPWKKGQALVIEERLTHYGLLNTVLDNWGLGQIGQAAREDRRRNGNGLGDYCLTQSSS